MSVDITHKEVAEMPDNSETDAFYRDPLDYGLGLDITELFHGELLPGNE